MEGRTAARHNARMGFARSTGRIYLVLMTGVNRFGQELARLRREKKISQAAVALGASVSEDYLGKIERGERDLKNVEFGTLWGIVEMVTEDPSERARLMDLAGGYHRRVFNAIGVAQMADRGMMPSPHESIEVYDRLSSERRAAARRVLRALEVEQDEEDRRGAQTSTAEARLLHNEPDAAEEGA